MTLQEKRFLAVNLRSCMLTINALCLAFLTGNIAAADEGFPSVIVAANDLFNHSDQRTLGLPLLASERIEIYRASEDNWKFCHTPNLVEYRGRLYLMWSNGEVDEDAAGQRVLHSVSTDGMNWSEPSVLLSPDMISEDPETSLMSAGWNVINGTLTAYTTVSVGRKFAQAGAATLWASDSHDGKTWGNPYLVTEGLFLEPPKRTGDGWVLLGQGDNRMPRFLYSDESAQPRRWIDASVAGAPTPGDWPEPSCYVRPDGSLVSTIRAHRTLGFILYAAESVDGGRTWRSGPTNFPDAVARVAAGNLPDGTAYLVGNPNPILRGRNVMAISLSKDGRLFDRAFALLVDPPPLKFPGHAKFAGWQYPSILVRDNQMYVAYSVGKEDIGVLRFPLSQLALEPRP